MSTFNQLSKKGRVKRVKKSRKTGLESCPQKKGVCISVGITSPKKPSSGKRKVSRVKLSNSKRINCHIPGKGGHNLTKFSNVLVRGCRVRDVPATNYRSIRGKFDLRYVYDRLTSRSKYGKKLSDIN
jgi:small subunit ribosomal protein S12